MDEIVNALARIQQEIQDSGVTLRAEGDRVCLNGTVGPVSLRLVRLYRPSSEDIAREAAPDMLLALTPANSKAARSAAGHDHLFLPGGGYRIGFSVTFQSSGSLALISPQGYAA